MSILFTPETLSYDSHQLASMEQLIESAFAKYSKVLAIRVDFSYRTQYQSGLTVEQVKEDLQRYLDSRRFCALFDDEIGFAWKLEYGSSFHYHLLFLFNGHKHCKHAYLAQQLCERWVQMTQGRGVAFNCNTQMPYYAYSGIGMIHREDFNARTNLNQACRYLCKQNNFMPFDLPARCRTFGRSVIR